MIDSSINFWIAFGAGLLTFVAPCVLPILPAYLGYISGVSLKDRDNKNVYTSKVFKNSIFFVLGFIFVFVLLGGFAASIGGILNQFRRPVQIVGGIFFIILGLHLSGVFKMPALAKYVHFKTNNKLTRFQYLNSFLVGLIFGFGWTPCIGPILAVILFWASQEATFWKGMYLLLSFGLGLGLPFIVLSLFTEKIMMRLKKMQKLFHYFEIFAGVLVIIIGILLIGDWLVFLSRPLTGFGTLEIWLNK